MAYHRRRSHKSSASSKKAIRYKKPTAKTQQQQILSLSRKVNLNARHIATQRYLAQHVVKYSSSPLTALTGFAPYRAFALNVPVTMNGGQVFGYGTDVTPGGKYHGVSTRVEFNIHPSKQVKTVDLTVFLVSPKNQKVAVDCEIYEAGTSLDPSTATPNPMTAGLDYSVNSGLCIMNDKRWTTHGPKNGFRIQVQPLTTLIAGTAPGTTTNQIQNQKKIRKVIYCKNPLKINNRNGAWHEVTNYQMTASQRMFLVCFTDVTNQASGPQAGPNIEIIAYHRGHTSA